MAFPKAFTSTQATYTYPIEATGNVEGIWAQSLPNMEIYCSSSMSFPAKAYDIFRKDSYTRAFYNRASISKWQKSCDMSYYQNQLNMAVFLATAGCGVSVNDHLLHKDPFVTSFFRFHTYYQVRKILHQMGCPIPGDEIFNKAKNRFDKIRYADIGTEFGLPHKPDFLYYGGDNYGLGSMYFMGHPIHGNSFVDKNKNYYFRNDDPPSYVNKQHMAKIDKLEQSDYGWMAFMLQEGKGFTRAGIMRLNDSIRTYIYCILGSQAQTRSPIVGSGGSSFDSQKQFIVLLEDSITQEQSLSLPEMIKRYEDAITNTHKRLNYAMGANLYMIPSDLVLKMGIVEGYNNNITIATATMKFGVNDVNSVKITSKKLPPLSGISDKVKRTLATTSNKVKPATENVEWASKERKRAEYELYNATNQKDVKYWEGVVKRFKTKEMKYKEKIDIPKIPSQPQIPKIPSVSTPHEDNKAMLSLGLGAVIGFGIIYFKR